MYSVSVSLGKWSDALKSIDMMQNQTTSLKNLLRAEVDLLSQTKPILSDDQIVLIAENEAKGGEEGSIARSLGAWLQHKIYDAPVLNLELANKLTQNEDNSTVSDNLFKIYPNPANNFIKISDNNSDYHISTIQIFDVLGRTCITKQIALNEQSLDIQQLKAGMYFIKIAGYDKTLTFVKMD